MCLVISFIFGFFAYEMYMSGNSLAAVINGIISLIFFGLIVRNILKVRKEKKGEST